MKKTLTSIASKLVIRKGKCPICGKPDTDKRRPPYGLVTRLNLVSRKHRTMLKSGKITMKKYIRAGYYTSSRAKLLLKK